MRIGAHISISGGLSKSIRKATKIGANCVQLFASSPRSWTPGRHSDDEIACFLDERSKAGIEPVFLHTIYLVNLATSSESLRKRSTDSVTSYFHWATQMKAAGVVTHLGSSGGLPRDETETVAAESLQEILAHSEGSASLLLETSAGAGNIVGADIRQMGNIIRRVDDAGRLGICLDTAHVFAAGYDISTQDGLDLLLDEIEEHIGLWRLKLVHANDSKTPLGSRLDRHENIGRGLIGEDAFRRILQHPLLRDIPVIIEVPGFDEEGPDAENIAILRELAER